MKKYNKHGELVFLFLLAIFATLVVVEAISDSIETNIQTTEVIIYSEQGNKIEGYQGEDISVFYHMDGRVTIDIEDTEITVTGGTVVTIDKEMSE